MRTGPNIRQRADGRYEARYQKGRDAGGRIIYGYCYGKSYGEAEEKRERILGTTLSGYDLPKKPRRMRLLILGAGSQGMVVKDIAQAIGIFSEIAFLDDNPNKSLAIDTCEHYNRYVNQYPIAIPSFGNSELRKKWIERLEEIGYIVPTLIHPTATVSPQAKIAEAVVVEAKAVVMANASISRGCIISSASVIDLDAAVESYSHISSSATITRAARVPAYSRVSSGTVYAQQIT